MYRPQFAFAAGVDCEEQRCIYGFDGTNLPTLNPPAVSSLLAPGEWRSKIPLVMDQDADFFLRALWLSAVGLEVRIEDSFANPICDNENALQPLNYQFPALWANSAGAGPAVLDGGNQWGIFCPAGSALLLYVYNPTSANIDLQTLSVTLHGVKRYKYGCTT